jgi:ArsR family transcriptional regulator
MDREKREKHIAVKNQLLEFHAEFCKTFSHPKRLEILDILKDGEMTLSAITERLGVSRPNACRYLAVLRMQRILTARRAGVNVYYGLGSTQLAQAIGLMQNALAQLMEGMPAIPSRKERRRPQ